MQNTTYSAIWKSTTSSGHQMCLSKSALGLSMGEDSDMEIEKQKPAGISTEANLSEIDIGFDGPSTPIVSKRSFAVQATSPHGP